MRVLALLSLAVAVGACSHKTTQRLGQFDVAWTAQPPSLSVRSQDGRELLRTAGAAFESRSTTASWEMQFGAFRPTEADAPWHATTSLTVQQSSAAQVALVVKQTDGYQTTILITAPDPAHLAIQLTPEPSENRIRASFACAANDHFLGFGSQSDAVDHRGHKVPLWASEPGIGKTNDDDQTNNDWFLRGARHAASYPLPTFLSNRGFAFLADTTHRAIFDLCKADANVWSVELWDHPVTLSLFDGPQPADALERLTKETGRQPLANDLALAPWNDAIFGSDHVRAVAKLLRDSKIPSGAIWTEDFRGGDHDGPDNYRLKEEWDVDRTLYPDIEKLASDLHDLGFRFLAYHNTFLTTKTQIIEQARAADVLIKQTDGTEYLFTGAKFVDASLVDLTKESGRAFVKNMLTKFLGYGFDGWMADFGEWLPTDTALSNGADAEGFHNEYPRAYHALSSEVIATRSNPNASAVLSRSGTLRTAPFQQVVWAGDQWTQFLPDDGLPTVVTMGLSLGLGGIAIFGHDIAGYQNLTNPPSTKELFFRWTTVGALSPVMRTHHGTKAAENWRFDSDAESTAHFARWSQFHARLWPYLRNAAQAAFEHGLPIMRQLALAYPQDAAVWTLNDEYLFGPSLLAAPVMVQGATGRDVYLPAGTWLPLEAGTPRAGGATVHEDVPLTEAALYAAAGSIVPMLPARLDTLMPAAASANLVTLDQVRDERTLLVFGGANGLWTDLDGTRYALTSSGSEEVQAVAVNGTVVPTCGSAMPCAEFDTARRRVRVQGNSLGDVAFNTAHGGSRLTVNGGLHVSEVVYRY
jgi:alpha-glucosidase